MNFTCYYTFPRCFSNVYIDQNKLKQLYYFYRNNYPIIPLDKLQAHQIETDCNYYELRIMH